MFTKFKQVLLRLINSYFVGSSLQIVVRAQSINIHTYLILSLLIFGWYEGWCEQLTNTITICGWCNLLLIPFPVGFTGGREPIVFKSNNRFSLIHTASSGRPSLTPISLVSQEDNSISFAVLNPSLLTDVKLFISLFNSLLNEPLFINMCEVKSVQIFGVFSYRDQKGVIKHI